MKLIFIGLGCALFVATCFAKNQNIRISGRIECCSPSAAPIHPNETPQGHNGQTQNQQNHPEEWDPAQVEQGNDDCVTVKDGKGVKGVNCDTKGRKVLPQQIQQQEVQKQQNQQRGQRVWIESDRVKSATANNKNCEAPLKAEITLIDHAKFLPDDNLKTVQIGSGQSEYIVDWSGDKILSVDPYVKIDGECKDGTTFGEVFDWTDRDETDIKQDYIIHLK